MTTLDLLSSFSAEFEILAFRFVEFPPWKNLQDFLHKPMLSENWIDRIEELSEKTGFPYWDCALQLSLDFPQSRRIEIIRHANHHNAIIKDFWIGAQSKKLEDLKNQSNIGLNSEVKMELGKIMHIPMMDFHLPISDNGILTVKEVVKHLGFQKGWIINSGNSYHFIGKQLVSNIELKNLLYKAILYGPLVDIRWIAHQLLEGSCTLRVSAKNGVMPIVECSLMD